MLNDSKTKCLHFPKLILTRVIPDAQEGRKSVHSVWPVPWGTRISLSVDALLAAYWVTCRMLKIDSFGSFLFYSLQFLRLL